jgi:hypothetical protein
VREGRGTGRWRRIDEGRREEGRREVGRREGRGTGRD